MAVVNPVIIKVNVFGLGLGTKRNFGTHKIKHIYKP